MTREELVQWATQTGWTLDPDPQQGYFRSENGLRYRMNIGDTEVRIAMLASPGWWVIVRSGDLKDMAIADGKLVGMMDACRAGRNGVRPRRGKPAAERSNQ